MQVQVKTSCTMVYDTSLVDEYMNNREVEELIINQLDGEVRWRIHEGFLTAGMGDVEVEGHDFAVNVQRYPHQDALHATVLLNVTYDLVNHDSSQFDYHKQLEYIFSHMAGEGSMSGETELIVDDWKFAPHGVEVSIVQLGRSPQAAVNAENSDPLYVIAIATAMREVTYQAEKGMNTLVLMSNEEAFNLYQRIVEHSNAGDDGFEIEEVYVYDQYREEDGAERSCDEILTTIHDQSVGVQQAIGSALKLAHEGLVDAAIEDELDSDANTWDLKEMVRRGAALQAPEHQDDPLAVSNESNSAPTLR